MEELLGNYAGARAVFERWMEWDPNDKAWMLYIRFEERCGELQRARLIFEKYLVTRPSQTSFLKFAKFEENHHDIVRARAAFEKAVSRCAKSSFGVGDAYFEILFQIEILPESSLGEEFYTKFAQFEERQKEFDR